METVNMADCSPESMSSGLGCGLDWTTALSVMHSSTDMACAAFNVEPLPFYRKKWRQIIKTSMLQNRADDDVDWLW